MRGWKVLVSTTATLCVGAAAAASAQTEVTLEVGASQMGAPLGLQAESARFGILGMRVSHYVPQGSGASLSLLAGRTLGGSTRGDFLTLSTGGTLAARWTPAWRAAFDARVVAFGVRAPYPYRALVLEGGPTLKASRGPLEARLSLLGGIGESRLEVWRVPGGPTRVFEDELWRIGGTGEVFVGRGAARVGAAGGWHDTPGGVFSSGGGRLLFAGDWGVVQIQGDVWRTPTGTETTAGITMVISLAEWSLRAFVGRSEPDPLTLAESSSMGGGFLVGHDLAHRGRTREAPGPYTFVASTGGATRVRFELRAPSDAGAVELLGDFTLWEAVPMGNVGGTWIVEVDVRPGTHHYGFLVDGEWYLPDDVGDVVPDEWGRQSAVLIVEGGT